MSSQAKRVTVGRKPGNTIVLTNADVSGDHAILTLIDALTNRWEIQDVGSRNGTFVDGQRILRKEVTPQNKITFGQTPLIWDQLAIVSHKPAAKKQSIADESKTQELKIEFFELPIGEKLKNVYEDFMDKKSRIEEIQKQEALNARYQSLGIPIAALFGASVGFLPPEYRYISIVGTVISLTIAVWSFVKSKKFTVEKKKLNMTKLTEQYDINYRCPYCQVRINDPYPVLRQIKNCRSCKKTLIS
ncbi:hypothetical protein DR864_28250 (plasmid) [Runella rosea]|uniref:FHA domain-containing protein n=1 Tax=Runella rosea TaxID=2259595 RepID=A0A344TSZ9_9BACT|nr:FHA domain-containing protein [Runella rosea]AXE21770.1 hypothetical protein DR864_28250 [Runella rosea]